MVNNYYKLMSDPPEYEDAIVTFIDKPPFITMMSGGLFLGIFLYFIFKQVTRRLKFPGSDFLPLGITLIIILLTVVRGRQIDGMISINTKSGWVHGSNRSQYWEGYITDVKNIIVLQRERSIDDTSNYVEYKLYLELDDKSSYEIPIAADLARIAIEAIEKAKAAIPIKLDQDSKTA